MVLKTKSIAKPESKSDGIRICIMRHPDQWAKYDIWMPQLSPSQKLRDELKKGTGKFPEFKKRFNQELLKNKKYLNFIVNVSEKQTITLMCIEDNPYHCHRSLVVEAIKKINPKLKIVLR